MSDNFDHSSLADALEETNLQGCFMKTILNLGTHQNLEKLCEISSKYLKHTNNKRWQFLLNFNTLGKYTSYNLGISLVYLHNLLLMQAYLSSY